MRKGFLTVRVDGELREIMRGMKLDRYKNHDIEVVVDKLAVRAKDEERLNKSVSQTLQQGGGLMMVLDADNGQTRYFSKQLMCPTPAWPTGNQHHITSRLTQLKEPARSVRGWVM